MVAPLFFSPLSQVGRPRSRSRSRSSVRTGALLVAFATAFAAGTASHHLWPREAHAQAVTSASTIYVPWEGLVFRTPDGRAIARLSRDAHGGILELYDDRQESGARLSSGALGASHPAAREPYALDDEDPWTVR
jgi:hypothetical protein